ncbi:aromatic amino acid lyase, partial [Staphylococcus capitis]|uniref:aromatic amino acid lyase n=1 Tax=Staphylococcus capitis TaxID=29388 RepID=UPI001642F824
LTESPQLLQPIIHNKQTIYPITTPFPLFTHLLIHPPQYNQLQLNLIPSHPSPIPKPFSQQLPLLIILFPLNTLFNPHSPPTLHLLQQLKFFINQP